MTAADLSEETEQTSTEEVEAERPLSTETVNSHQIERDC